MCAGSDVDMSELLQPGDVLDDVYEIQAKLGEGGMGQVFDAFDRRLFRHVAIKVARPGTSVSREAKALAALGVHPSIVTVHALGVHQGLEYAVMSRIGGVTLQQYLEQRFADGQALTIPEVLHIGVALAEALAFVHDAGMAHRDVKPANVILAPRDRVVLTDFGIFRPECDHSSSPLVWGTPEYMAPEQAFSEIAPGGALPRRRVRSGHRPLRDADRRRAVRRPRGARDGDALERAGARSVAPPARHATMARRARWRDALQVAFGAAAGHGRSCLAAAQSASASRVAG